MIVQILEDVFIDDKNDDRLDNLWNTIEGPHSLYLKEDSEIDALMNSSWFLGLRQTKQKAIAEMILMTIQSSSSIRPRIRIANNNEEHYSIEEAIRFLGQPFSLILENSYKDSFFFNALLDNFKKKGKQISTAKASGWFVYGMGGGSTIPDMLKSKMDEFKEEIFTKESKRYLRCFVLVDSDRCFPSDEKQQRLVNFLKQNDIPYHILEKRETENYLPDEVFSAITDNREFVDAYLRLKPIQKDYFDIERGFDDKSLDSYGEGIQQLYNSVPSKDFAFFRKQSLSTINGGKNFKSEFPQLFNNTKVTRENLLARCAHHSIDPTIHPYNPNELPDLLTEISNLL